MVDIPGGIYKTVTGAAKAVGRESLASVVGQRGADALIKNFTSASATNTSAMQGVMRAVIESNRLNTQIYKEVRSQSVLLDSMNMNMLAIKNGIANLTYQLGGGSMKPSIAISEGNSSDTGLLGMITSGAVDAVVPIIVPVVAAVMAGIFGANYKDILNYLKKDPYDKGGSTGQESRTRNNYARDPDTGQYSEEAFKKEIAKPNFNPDNLVYDYNSDVKAGAPIPPYIEKYVQQLRDESKKRGEEKPQSSTNLRFRQDISPTPSPDTSKSSVLGMPIERVHELYRKFGGPGPTGSNGMLLDSALTTVDGTKAESVTAADYLKMKEAAEKDGVSWGKPSGYRTYDEQVVLAEQKGIYGHGGLAANPGSSNHGLGMAFDLSNMNDKAFKWLQQHGADYGFKNIPGEKWHWEHTAQRQAALGAGGSKSASLEPSNQLAMLEPKNSTGDNIASDSIKREEQQTVSPSVIMQGSAPDSGSARASPIMPKGANDPSPHSVPDVHNRSIIASLFGMDADPRLGTA